MGQSREARILVVDDFDGWRMWVRKRLRTRPEWKVIAEANDGPEAVQKAKELEPDIILLDIQLPTLNGIETAKLIRQVSPRSNIVFLTETNDPDIMNAALEVGKARFVRKTDAAACLFEAIATALDGL